MQLRPCAGDRHGDRAPRLALVKAAFGSEAGRPKTTRDFDRHALAARSRPSGELDATVPRACVSELFANAHLVPHAEPPHTIPVRFCVVYVLWHIAR